MQDYVISLNGTRFHVTENLMLALRHIRQNTTKDAKAKRKQGRGGDGTVTLWIDAVCINQADADERNVQVQKMSHIYRDASEVISWLGVENDLSAEAMQLLRRWVEALTRVKITKFDDVNDKVEWFRNGTNARDFVRSIDRLFPLRGWLG